MNMNNYEYHYKNNILLNPDFVTGLTEAEGCFSLDPLNAYVEKKSLFNII